MVEVEVIHVSVRGHNVYLLALLTAKLSVASSSWISGTSITSLDSVDNCSIYLVKANLISCEFLSIMAPEKYI